MKPTIAGGHFLFKTLIINDNSELVTVRRNAITVYNITSGEVITRIASSASILTLCHYDKDNFFCVYKDGTIDLYDSNTLMLKRQIKTKCDLVHCRQVSPSTLYMETAKSSSLTEFELNTNRVNNVEIPRGFPSCDGNYIASNSEHELVIYDIKKGVKTSVTVPYDIIKSVQPHPTQPLKFFTTLSSGAIILWHFDQKATPRSQKKEGIKKGQRQIWIPGLSENIATTVYHWHRYGGFVMSISPDAQRFISGGHEGVLVIWNTTTGENTFVSGFLSQIKRITISSDNRTVAVSLGCNEIWVLEIATKKILGKIIGLLQPPLLKSVDGPNGLLVFSGSGPVVQFFDPVTDRCVSSAEVSRRNNVIWSDARTPLPQADVKHITFVDGSAWMAVYDYRPINSNYHESNLRFFRRKEVEGYEELLVIPEPFEKDVTSLVGSPAHKIIVTTSLDHVFKVWVLVTRQTIQTKGGVKNDVTWKCRSIGAYYGEPSFYSAFSKDGSVLVVSFATALTVWDVFANKLVFTIPLLQSESCRFYFSADSTYLVVSQPNCISIWNMLTRKVEYSYKTQQPFLAVHPDKDLFAFTTVDRPHDHQATRLFLFRLKDSSPLSCWNTPSQINGLTFYTSQAGIEYLCVVNHSNETMLFPIDGKVDQPTHVPLSIKPVEKTGLIIRNNVVSEELDSSVSSKIIPEEILDGLEANLAEEHSVFNAIVDCLLK